MASKASEWAVRLDMARDNERHVSREKPAPFCLHLSANTRIDVSVDDNGKPRWQDEHARNGYQPDEARLIEFANWILATFGEPNQ